MNFIKQATIFSFFLLLIISLGSCQNEKSTSEAGDETPAEVATTETASEDLRKLSYEELVERARKRIMPLQGGFRVLDPDGKEITMQEAGAFDQEKFFVDQYVNEAGEVKEIRIRASIPEDKNLVKMMEKAFNEGAEVELIEIDCDKQKEMLLAIYDLDQEMRQEGKTIDPEVDFANQQKVASIIEKCGFPDATEVSARAVEAAFLVIQHAGSKMREKYFPMLQKSADKGHIDKSILAIMEDRILMDNGKKQKYGSQFKRVEETGEWGLYAIEDPANVNKRRKAVGMEETVEEYVKHFDLEYDPKKFIE